MVVRRYVVKDMPEAVVSIRKELGKDAVILSTKRIRVKKWLGLRWQTRLEVTAAVGGDIPLHHRDVERMSRSEVASTLEEGGVAQTAVSTLTKPVEELSTQSFGTALASAFNAYETAAKAIVQPANNEYQSILQELTALKGLLTEQATQPPSSTSERSPLAKFLEREGLSEQQIEDLLPNGQHINGDHSKIDEVIATIIQRLGSNEVPKPISGDSKVVAFIGPTGVGKTTTIAKIAALHVLAGQRRVGLLTTDTYRIAAIQQLQTYAGILDIPFVVANGVDDIPNAMKKLGACDLVLVDTAGRNFRDDKTIVGTTRLLTALSPDECVLVVSLTAKPEDADSLVSTCIPLEIDKLLFTKLDETDTYGMIPRLMLKYNLPLSYITIGQNVPDDIDMRSVRDVLSVWGGGSI